MQSFYAALNHIDKIIYTPTKLIVNAIQEEIQNSAYAAGQFKLTNDSHSKTIRFRVAKQTPTKVGQFVTLWEKDANNNNQPYRLDNAPDLLVITVFKVDNINALPIPKIVALYDL